MLQGPRLGTEGVLHHVMVKGLERRKIFLSDTDQEDLIRRFSEVLAKARMGLYAWSLLGSSEFVGAVLKEVVGHRDGKNIGQKVGSEALSALEEKIGSSLGLS